MNPLPWSTSPRSRGFFFFLLLPEPINLLSSASPGTDEFFLISAAPDESSSPLEPLNRLLSSTSPVASR
jgi:hypothetical protein